MMSKTVKIILISALSLVMAALVFYCVQFGKMLEEKQTEKTTVSIEDALQAAEQLSFSAETAWKNGTAKHIALSDDGSSTSASGVQILGNAVTVTSPGIYRISGALTEGQLTIDCNGSAVLILDDAEIANSADAAIRVSNADHTLIYLPEGSMNRLVSGTEQEITAANENTDTESASGAALYSRDTLSIAGSGKLTVAGYINNAVATTDHLIVLCGELEVEAMNNGLKGKDSVSILDGKVTIHSGNDGIKSMNGADAGCGSIDIRGGEINILSLGDGMHAEGDLSVEDGIITITAGDAASVYSGMPVKTEDGFMPKPGEAPPDIPNVSDQGSFPGDQGGMGFPGGQGGMGFPGGQGRMTPQSGETPPEMPQGTPQQERGDRTDRNNWNQAAPSGNMRGQEDMRGNFPDRFDREWNNSSNFEASTKGLKSGGDLSVSGGSITVNSSDDCIHANGSITVSGGTFQLSSGDDAFHADDTLTVSDGDITVSQSYEGLEGHLIYLSGGNISVTASDDGINAGGGSFAMFGRRFGAEDTDDSSLPLLKISGGTVHVNADGDGLDSNGDLIVEGGNIIVDGPTNSGNGALDSGSENGGHIVCNGGTILAIGSSGMAETFEKNSAQCSFIKNLSETMPAGTQIAITDESGKTVFEHKSVKSFNSIVFSSPELVIGSTCTITVGNQTETITIESISNGSSSGFGMRNGFDRQNRK